MVWFQQVRARFLGPLLRLLTRLRITADHVTFISLLMGFGFCIVWWKSPAWAVFCLLLHALLDGLDGPLARHQQTASAKGSFTDTMCDQLVVTASMIVLMFAEKVHIVPGTIYIFCYAMVVTFAMVLNAMGKPYRLVVRPRFVVYTWVAIDLWLIPLKFSPEGFYYLIWILNIPLVFTMVTGFFSIRQNLK